MGGVAGDELGRDSTGGLNNTVKELDRDDIAEGLITRENAARCIDIR